MSKKDKNIKNKEVKEIKDAPVIENDKKDDNLIDVDEKKVTANDVELHITSKMDERIKTLKNQVIETKDFGVEMWIPTKDLLIDEDTQRGLMVSQVEKIINEFNPSSFGRLTVSKRKNGYYVTNGQHRLVALRAIGIEKAPCLVVENPFENENDIKKFDAINFLEINQNSQAVRAIDKYRIGVSAQLPDWLRVKEVIEENNLRAGTTRNSVNALACIHRYINSSKNPKTIQRRKSQMSKAIKILNNTVGVPQITHVSLQAVCILVREYENTKLTTVDKLIAKLGDVELHKLLSTAITMKNSGTQKNVVTGLAQLLVQTYNTKCRKEDEKLPLDRLFVNYKEPVTEENLENNVENLENVESV